MLDAELRNNIRSVLAADLGLTREAVRAEMLDVIRTTIDARCTRMEQDGTLQRMLTAAILQLLDGAAHGGTNANSAIRRELREAVATWVIQHITIEPTSGR